MGKRTRQELGFDGLFIAPEAEEGLIIRGALINMAIWVLKITICSVAKKSSMPESISLFLTVSYAFLYLMRNDAKSKFFQLIFLD